MSYLICGQNVCGALCVTPNKPFRASSLGVAFTCWDSTVQVTHVGVAHQIVADGAHEGKETIVRESELPVGVSAGITLGRELVGIQFRS